MTDYNIAWRLIQRVAAWLQRDLVAQPDEYKLQTREWQYNATYSLDDALSEALELTGDEADRPLDYLMIVDSLQHVIAIVQDGNVYVPIEMIESNVKPMKEDKSVYQSFRDTLSPDEFRRLHENRWTPPDENEVDEDKL